jgi:ribosomal protein S18 acetylase RimI-like enzyme
MGISIRTASESDYRDLCLLEQGPSGDYYQAAVFMRQVMTLWPRFVLVAERNSLFAGYLVAAVSAEDPRSGWVLRVRVKEEMRRKGVGTALVDRICHLMQENRVQRLFLSCSPVKEGALKFYETRGFQICGNKPEYFGSGEDRYILCLDL